ncbi:MAG: DUF4880 domain-containing protein [Gluconacetobacter liquefaciens]
MTTHPGPDPTDEAISWQIRLTDAPDDPALRAACQAWQDASPENGQAWRKAERIRRLAGAAVRAEGAAPRHSVPRPRAIPAISARRPPFRPPLAAATAIAATLVMAVSLGPTLYDRFTADYTTGVAGRGARPPRAAGRGGRGGGEPLVQRPPPPHAPGPPRSRTGPRPTTPPAARAAARSRGRTGPRSC